RPDIEWGGVRAKGVRGSSRYGTKRSCPARENQAADASTGPRAALDQEWLAEQRDCRRIETGGVDRKGSRDRDSAQTRTLQPQQGDCRNWEDCLAVARSLPTWKGRAEIALLTGQLEFGGHGRSVRREPAGCRRCFIVGAGGTPAHRWAKEAGTPAL